VQNPYKYGYESVNVLVKLAKGDKSVIPANKVMDIPARQIRKNNVDEFWADLKKKTGK
jgi:ribose transport system substrate-binding protein